VPGDPPFIAARPGDEDRLVEEVVALARSWSSNLRERDEAAYAVLDERHADVLRALDLAIARGRRRDALEIVGGIWMYWIIRGHHADADERCRAALALPGAVEPEIEVGGVIAASEIARVRADWARAAELKERALALNDACYVDRRRAALLADLAHIWIHLGDLETAERFANEAVAIRRSVARDSPDGVGHALLALAEVREHQSRFDEAVAIYEESIELWGRSGLTGHVAFIRGRLLGRTFRRVGDVGAAYGTYRRALVEATRLNDTSTATVAIQGLAWVALERGDVAGAVRRLGSIANDACQSTLEAHEREWYEDDVRRTRELVPPGEFAAAWAVGAASPYTGG
jgi:tetratricopeptide (TPR) repeat protein